MSDTGVAIGVAMDAVSGGPDASASIGSSSTLLKTTAETGPRLSDAEFFNSLDLTLPGLEMVRVAVIQQNWPSARAAFAQYFKAREMPRWFVMQTEPPIARARRPDTTVADKLLQHQWQYLSEWFDLGADIDWSSNQLDEGSSATLSWSANLNRHYCFTDLADAYVKTGEEKYAAEIVAQMLDWIADCPVLQNASGNTPYHYAWETLNTACRAAGSWPDALYRILPSQALNADALVTIVKSLVEHARHLDRWPTGGNWLAAESLALVTVGTLLPESTEACQWRQHAITRLYDLIEEEVYPDGMETELALGYSNMVMASYSKVLELLQLNQRADELPSGYLAQLERMYEYQLYAMMPNGRIPGLNDSRDKSALGALRDGYSYFPDRQDFLWGGTAGSQGEMPEMTSVAFPYSGQYVMRSGWDSDARYMLLDAGPFGTSHQHEDKLHLVAYAYGQSLLLDSGFYRYDASPYRKYAVSTAGHNTILVDGQSQRRRDAYETWRSPTGSGPLDNTWVTDDAFDYVVGQYDSGYGRDHAIQVTHTREIVFMKPDYWVVVDTLDPQDAAVHTYDSLFHMNAETARIDPETKSVTTQNADSANLQLWPVSSAGLSVEVIQGQEQGTVQGWTDAPWRPIPTADYRLRGQGKQRLVTVVYPLAPGQASPIVSVQAMPVFAGGQQATDAVACEIRFADGHVDQLMVAEEDGTLRSYGATQTSAMIYGTTGDDDRSRTFQYPDVLEPQDPVIQVLPATIELADGTETVDLDHTAVDTSLIETSIVPNPAIVDLPVAPPDADASISAAPVEATVTDTSTGMTSIASTADEVLPESTVSDATTGPEVQVLPATNEAAESAETIDPISTPADISMIETSTVTSPATADLPVAPPPTIQEGFTDASVSASTDPPPVAPSTPISDAPSTFAAPLDAVPAGACSSHSAFVNNDDDENLSDFTMPGIVIPSAPEIQVLSGTTDVAGDTDSIDLDITLVDNGFGEDLAVVSVTTADFALTAPVQLPARSAAASAAVSTIRAPTIVRTFRISWKPSAAGVHGGRRSPAASRAQENSFGSATSSTVGTDAAAGRKTRLSEAVVDLVDLAALAALELNRETTIEEFAAILEDLLGRNPRKRTGLDSESAWLDAALVGDPA